jgi:glutamine cyclotransferase
LGYSVCSNILKIARRAAISAVVLFLITGCGIGQKSGPGNGNSKLAGQPKSYTYTVINKYPHDAAAFTQGLQFHGGFLYESTGLVGQSSVRKVELKTGKVLQRRDLTSNYFGEGLTILGDKVYQLTWQSKKGFIYDLASFTPLGEFPYDWEGWGLTNDGKYLIASDGSNKLRFIDPASFNMVRSIDVFLRGRPLDDLNELEYIKGEIYSNIWHSNTIVRIDPANGNILGLIDMTDLAAGLRLGPEDVLNGIAYDPETDYIFVTGKRWPAIFAIRLRQN